MTNPELRTELRMMLEGIATDASRSCHLADLPLPETAQERDEIVEEFRLVQARLWGDVSRCISLAGDVEIETGLTDENYELVGEIQSIHDSLVSGDWGDA